MVSILLIMIAILFIYILYMKKQINDINIQIEEKIKSKSRQPVRVQLLDKKLNSLVFNINNIFMSEEKLRLNIIHHEEKMKDMTANISHDLRTPLTAIKGYIQLLNKNIVQEEENKMIEKVLNHINELEQLINNFFELSYLEISKPELNLQKLNITNILQDSLVDYVYQFEEHKIEVNFKSQKPYYIYADSEKVKRIINNLIKNCLFHSAGNLEVNVTEDIYENNSDEAAESYITISFINPVKNKSEIDVENLFDRFYVADKSRNKSTGLGLSIVKILTEQMSGKVHAAMDHDNLRIDIKFKKYKGQ